MGIRRHRKDKGENPRRLDLSFLLVPLTVVLLICLIIGLGIWGWNTIRNGRDRIVSEAFMETFSVTVPGHGEYRSENSMATMTVSLTGSSCDAAGVIDILRSYGIQPYSMEDDLSSTGETHTGTVELHFKGMQPADLENVVERVVRTIPGYDGHKSSIERNDAEKDEHAAIRMAFADARSRGLSYLQNVFGADGGVVTGVDEIVVVYDDSSGTTTADLDITFRIDGGEDV